MSKQRLSSESLHRIDTFINATRTFIASVDSIVDVIPDKRTRFILEMSVKGIEIVLVFFDSVVESELKARGETPVTDMDDDKCKGGRHQWLVMHNTIICARVGCDVVTELMPSEVYPAEKR